MRGYKGFKKDEKGLYCQPGSEKKYYPIGKAVNQEGELNMCNNGIHFCKKIEDVHNYYGLLDDTITEIEVLGEVITNGSKSVTGKIKVVKELNKAEILEMCNSGKKNTGLFNSGDRNSGYGNSGYGNSGYGNSGDWNSGDRNSGYGNSGYGNSGYGNSGDWNSGDRNSGYWNSGDRNSGYRNSGYGNSGDRNSGYRNSGYRNSGDRNSGYGNNGNYNSGLFNTDEPNVRIFNMETDMKMSELKRTDSYNALFSSDFNLTEWVYYAGDEKDENKKPIGGYLKTYTYKAACANWWSNMTDKNKILVKTLPNFNAVIFEEITGIVV